jgi:hypothetical protein
MRDVFKPIESSWAARFGALCLVVTIGAGLMHWVTLGLVAGVCLLGCCGAIAETQVKILKDHIEKLEERVENLEGQIR